ncbi:MAG TPA: 16S rRNA (uracil(1498)-N(3))-methyltransferase [Aquifex aeolicus]|uniref:Ribosomal RNA small subunit methyltransferase E n=1 Tax=Aquifex aeolicus TaxID=63363 RepID=A0A9D1CF12_AQUAO|nr:16S rRNA (uracil(1498)-N(3))-methyltransferase [Aquificales bacterium]HIP86055.1 16S rRNA (uracil(1498)-N(3))-methyltransferase [Aquifex sp.]HIP97916.1 16S rRNA (uracil(1498)-N(3))-methyltransferase [Aquifex aeolicus]HIQ26618.1 16S rRNA (uracil(1498)-N(3))-methyltransferase [Aquifex aeolicus]
MERFLGRLISPTLAVVEEDLRHLKVKRVKVGDIVEVLEEASLKPYLCKLVSLEKRRAVFEIVKELTPNIPRAFVRLYQCVPVKVSTFDEIVQRATEVGVSQIVPVISKRSFQKLPVIEEKIARWNRIVRESLKQCGRHHLPQILPPVRLEDVNPEGEYLNLFAFEREENNNLFKVLKFKTPSKGANIIVGPEGGFSKEEAQSLVNRGFLPVSLGNFTLRAETASVAVTFAVYNALATSDK